jgi:hypothetical protein
MYDLNGGNKIQRLLQSIVLCDDDQSWTIWKIPKKVAITEYKYVLLMKTNFTYKSVGVLMTRFGPSEKYVRVQWRYQSTDVITEYCIAEKSIDE